MEKKVQKMNPEAKALFLQEIRQRIPDDPKEKHTVLPRKLKSGNSFSLDGLICEAYLKAHKMGWIGHNENACLNSTHCMPKKVMEWAGLERRDPYIKVDGEIKTLSVFNDTRMPNYSEELYNLMNINF